MSAAPPLPPRRAGSDGPVLVAAICAFAMIANQVAGKAVRDALFLSSFDISVLPRMIVAASLLTIGAVLLASRTLSRVAPPRLVPLAFLISGGLQIGFGSFVSGAPRFVAVGFFVHMAVFGAVLISWYWSMITERFDPSTARRRIGRIAGGGTLGGLVGGLLAERVAASLTLGHMLPILGALHILCAGLAFRVGMGSGSDPVAPARDEPSRNEPATEGARTGFRVVRDTPYLRNLAFLVLGGTVAAALLDFVFKANATRVLADGDELLRFFGLYYTGVAALTFLIQSSVTRRALQKLQPARTAALLPVTVGLGGLVAMLVPGFAAIGAARGAESAVRSSLFRSAYELFYTPLPRAEKRSAKTIVDVGFDRLGDAVGGGLVQLALLAGAAAPTLLTGAAAAIGFAGVIVARRLHAGYIGALARSLVDRGRQLEKAGDDFEATQSIYLQTVAHVELSGPLPDLGDDVTRAVSTHDLREAVRKATSSEGSGLRPAPVGRPGPGPGAGLRIATARPADPLLERARELRCGDPARVRRALGAGGTLRSELVPFVMPLLAWDAVSAEAVEALRPVAARHAGALLDCLLDPDEEFAIRRRVPRVLAACPDERAVEGLLRALDDRRFEVRYQVGIALSRIRRSAPDVCIDTERVLAAVEREAKVDRKVWEGHRLLDEVPATETSPFQGEIIRDRTSRSLEHVFTMLSLAYPPEPLRIAYRGLHAEDRSLRGTALEYLDSILPRSIRRSLAPFLSPDRTEASGRRTADEVLDSLMNSQESIRLDLEALRRRGIAPPDPDTPSR